MKEEGDGLWDEKFCILSKGKIEGYYQHWKGVSPFLGFWARGQKSDLLGLGLFLDQLGGLYCFGELFILSTASQEECLRTATIKSSAVFQVFPMYR